MKGKTLKLWITLTVLILLIGAILFQQSRNNREQLMAQSIKGIEITKGNLLSAYRAYHAGLEGYLYRHFIEKFEEKESPQSRGFIAKELNKLFESNKPDITKFNFAPNLEDEASLSILSRTPAVFQDKHHVIRWDTEIFDPAKLKTESKIEEKLGFEFEGLEKWGDQNPLSVSVESEIKVERLLKKDQTNRFFDHIMITDDQGIGIYPSEFQHVRLLDFDRIDSQDTVLQLQAGARVTKLDISTQTYLGFYVPVVINGSTLYLMGTKEEQTFEKVGMRINFNLLVTLLYGLVILLTSIPVLAVVNLQKGDVLSQGKIFAAGLSLMFSMTVLGFGFSQFSLLERYVEKEQPYFQKMKSFYFEKFKRLYRTTGYVDFYDLKEIIPDSCGILEMLHIENKKISRLHIYKDSEFKPLIFENAQSSFIDISERDYVSHFDEPRAKKHFVGAHYSRGSGKLEAVISSKDSLGDCVSAITFSTDKLGFKLDSIKRFLVFKEDGKVVHKSQGILTPIDSLKDALSDEKWQEIKTLIKENAKTIKDNSFWEISLYHNGYPYIGILQPIDLCSYDQGLWSLYLIKKNLYHLKSSMVSMEAVGLLAIYLLVLIAITFINRSHVTQPKLRLFDRFTYDWLYPEERKKSRYFLLILINLFLILVLGIAFLANQFHMLDFLALVILTTVQASILLYVILGPHWRKENFKDDRPYVFWMMLIWFISALALLYFGKDKLTVPVLIVLFGLNFFTVFMKSKGLFAKWEIFLEKRFGFWKKLQFQKLFVLYFLSWALLIGFLPGFLLHASTYHFEKRIWESEKICDSEKMIPISQDIPDWVKRYEKARRGLFSMTVADPELQSSLNPGLHRIQAAFVKSPANSEKLWSESKPMQLFLNSRSPLLFFLMILAFIGTAYVLIGSILRRVYLFDFDFGRHGLERDCETKPFAKVFLCSLDTVQKYHWIRCQLGYSAEELLILNIAESDTSKLEKLLEKEKPKLVLIENIHCLKDFTKLSELVPIWISITTEKGIPLVLGSGIAWKEILSKIEDQDDRLQISEIFNDFFFEIVPLDFALIQDKSIAKDREIAFGQNRQLVNELISARDLDVENKVILIQRYNKAYYMNIWEELSFAEKKMCYYFSKEGFLNPANWDVLTELVQKGIFYKHEKTGKIKLFNKTFRHFILSHIREGELQRFRQDEKANGSASTIQVAGVSFVLLSLAMIGYFDKNFLNEVFAYLSGILGVMGSIYSLFSKGLSKIPFVNSGGKS